MWKLGETETERESIFRERVQARVAVMVENDDGDDDDDDEDDGDDDDDAVIHWTAF